MDEYEGVPFGVAIALILGVLFLLHHVRFAGSSSYRAAQVQRDTDGPNKTRLDHTAPPQAGRR